MDGAMAVVHGAGEQMVAPFKVAAFAVEGGTVELAAEIASALGLSTTVACPPIAPILLALGTGAEFAIQARKNKKAFRLLAEHMDQLKVQLSNMQKMPELLKVCGQPVTELVRTLEKARDLTERHMDTHTIVKIMSAKSFQDEHFQIISSLIGCESILSTAIGLFNASVISRVKKEQSQWQAQHQEWQAEQQRKQHQQEEKLKEQLEWQTKHQEWQAEQLRKQDEQEQKLTALEQQMESQAKHQEFQAEQLLKKNQQEQQLKDQLEMQAKHQEWQAEQLRKREQQDQKLRSLEEQLQKIHQEDHQNDSRSTSPASTVSTDSDSSRGSVRTVVRNYRNGFREMRHNFKSGIRAC